jgi:class 3 adenylate cyclase/tetratricopeptide (TPR) repeat protein
MGDLPLPVVDSVTMAVCRICGKENPGEARFCLACGTSLADGLALRKERKVVTVLFADLVGFTARAEQLDPEDVHKMLSPYHGRLRAEIVRFGGTVEKFIGDAVMALFGAPVAHEDDAERGVRAALAIRDAIAEDGAGLQLRIGVNTGEVLVALGARPVEGEGMAFGDVVNTAARLQAAAPANGVVVGETTYWATRHAIAYRRAEPVAAKGKKELVAAWEAKEVARKLETDEQPRAPFIGRGEELGLLVDALNRARRDAVPQLVTLVGEPGIGKSRLVAELFQFVEQDPEPVVWREGRSLPYGDTGGYRAMAEIVKTQAGVLETDSAEAATRRLRASVLAATTDENEADWVESHLRPLIGLVADLTPGPDRRSEGHAAWRRYLEGVARQAPLVLLFEDLHWADDGVLDFFDSLVGATASGPILLVGTARPELLARRPDWIENRENRLHVTISALSSDETARLLAGLLEQAALSAKLQSLVLGRAEGNPLYTQEYVRMLHDRGFLVRSDDAWQLAERGPIPMPESIQALIAARLDALGPDEKRLAQDAAVVGKVFWRGALAGLGTRERPALDEDLRALEQREFVRRERSSAVENDTQYTFLHQLVRDVAYGQIPRAARAEKHRLAAEWIESLSADRTEDVAEMLAHHYLEALELARAAELDASDLRRPALRAFGEASERALALSSFESSLRYAEKALELTALDDPGRPVLLLRAARSRIWLGEADPALIEQARDLALVLGQHELAAEALVTLEELFWFRGEQEIAARHGEEAVAIVERLPPSGAKARVLSAHARVLVLNGRNDEATELGRAALPLAEHFGLNHVVAYTLNTLGLSRFSTGDEEGGLRDLERSLELALAHNLADQIHYGYNNLASCYVRKGRIADASGQLALARASAERFGLREGLRLLDAEDVFFCELRGEWEEADRRASAFLDEAPSHYMSGPCHCIRSGIRLARGDLEGSLADSLRALEIAESAKDPQQMLPALLARVGPLAASGQRQEAEELVDRLLLSGMLAEEWLRRLPGLCVRLCRAEAYLDAARREPQRTPWLEAGIATTGGDHLGAAAIYESIGAVPDEAEARLRAAEALAAAGRVSDSGAEAARALAFYRRVGAWQDVRRAEALLASTS